MAWTSETDVTNAWLSDDDPPEVNKIKVWIGKAEREIRRKVPDLQQRIDAEAAEDPELKDLLEDVIDVTVAMVTRVFNNPKGLRSINESLGTGPLSEGRSITLAGDALGKLELTSEELEKLSGTKRGGAYEVDLFPMNFRGVGAWPG